MTQRSADVTGVNIEDGGCSVTDGSGVTVPANGTATASYTCTYASNPAPGTNTATATWSDIGSPNTRASGSAGFDFSSVEPTIVKGSVDVSDTLGGTLGTVSSGDASPTFHVLVHVRRSRQHLHESRQHGVPLDR
jgi:hypothetical protein